MKTAQNSLDAIRRMVVPVVEDAGYEIYDLRIGRQGGKATLQISIDSLEGIKLEDCEKVSRKVSLLLDVEDPLDFPYSLEVSSPGIFRELRGDKDFARFIGERVKLIVTENAGGGCHFGTLSAWDEHKITLSAEKGDLTFDRAETKKIELAPLL